MRALAIAALAAIPALMAVPALAQEQGPYINLGYSNLDSDGINNGVLGARAGYAFHPNFAVEAEGGIGIADDTVGGATVKTDGTLGAYAVGRLPVSTNFNLLGRVGYQHLWATAEAAGIEAEADDGSFAVGVGAEVMFDDVNGIRGDYTRYTEGEGTNAISLSYVRKF
jgi:outer membrane immunogenic protein